MHVGTPQCGQFKQSYYNDHHESEMVVKDRLQRYIPEMDRDELRQPLWVQLTQAEYDALAAATVKGNGELPHGYRYTCGGVQMVELHVDDSDHFDSFRNACPLGGEFSVRWLGRPHPPQFPPSPPPSNLPHPAADTMDTANAASAQQSPEDVAAAEGCREAGQGL